jgi:hypothetical protein
MTWHRPGSPPHENAWRFREFPAGRAGPAPLRKWRL